MYRYLTLAPLLWGTVLSFNVEAETTTDWQTMPAGTYTMTSSGNVQVIIVSVVGETTTSSSASSKECPDECDCAKIEDKDSHEFFQCATNPNCEHCLTTTTQTFSSGDPADPINWPTTTLPANF